MNFTQHNNNQGDVKNEIPQVSLAVQVAVMESELARKDFLLGEIISFFSLKANRLAIRLTDTGDKILEIADGWKRRYERTGD